jgi:hypothetical protein
MIGLNEYGDKPAGKSIMKGRRKDEARQVTQNEFL